MTTRKNAGNTRGKPFAAGNAGRPSGARHKVTRAVEALLEGQFETLTQAAITKALEGDGVALRLCLDRIAPPRRDAPISISLPAVTSAADAVVASSALLDAVAAGEVTPGEAGPVMALLVAHKCCAFRANDAMSALRRSALLRGARHDRSQNPTPRSRPNTKPNLHPALARQ